MIKKIFTNTTFVWITLIIIGFIVNVINEQLKYPFSQIIGWIIIVIGVICFFIEAIVNKRFK